MFTDSSTDSKNETRAPLCNHSAAKSSDAAFTALAGIQIWPDAGLKPGRVFVMGNCRACDSTLGIDVAADSDLANLARQHKPEPAVDYMALALLSMRAA